MKKENDRIRPDFYENFTCTADKCPITCCQEWKIAVDPETARKWKTVVPPETVTEQKKNLSAYITKKDGELVIGLDKEHRCPFLAVDRYILYGNPPEPVFVLDERRLRGTGL